MFKLSVPIMNVNFKRGKREKFSQMLREMGAERVLLAIESYETDEQKKEKVFSELKENVKYLKEQGFEVGAWLWTFMLRNHPEFTYMKSSAGFVSGSFVCPSCDDFRKFAGNYLKKVAECGVDMILYDDDYRYGYFAPNRIGCGCVCENHIAFAEKILGEKFPDDAAEKYLTSGGTNKYRSAWLKANRHFFLKFAEEMRGYLNEVNPKIRLGLCSSMSVWDFDGASPVEISKILAGDTKPFLRLSAAPYWAVEKQWDCRLQDTVETERMQLSWCRGEDIEVVSEGDVYPRPRYKCPASYLEGFDTAMRVTGDTDGSLKYVFDYTSGADYETGYFRQHIKNMGMYKEIDDIFAGKDSVGVRVFEQMRKFEHMDVPENAKGDKVVDMFFSPAAKMLTASSIPTVYEGEGISAIAFGENAKYLSDGDMKNGIILDATAAINLFKKGIDVGIENTGENIMIDLRSNFAQEYFADEEEYVPSGFTSAVYNHVLKSGVKIQSFFVKGEDKYPASYIYENGKGQRFFVFLFDGYFANEYLYRQYARQRQLISNIVWLSGKTLPAVIKGNPDLYMQCKKEDGKLSVGLWNFFADSVETPRIALNKEYKSIRFVNCSGNLEGNMVTLDKLGAFEYAFFEVSEQ